MAVLLRRFLGPYRLKAVIGVITKMVEVVLEVLTPLVIARMIDEGALAGNVGQVVRLGLLLLAFAVVSYGFTFVCQRLAAQVSQGMGTDLRNALYRKVMELSSAEIDRFGTPSLITRTTNDVNQVQLCVALSIRTLTRWPLLALGSIVAALLIDLRLGLVFLVCMPAITAVFVYAMGRSIPYYRAMQSKLDGISLVTREHLEGSRVIRAFGQQEAERRRGSMAIDEQADTAIAVGRYAALLNPATFVILNLGVAVILWLGGLRVDAGELTAGNIVAFVSYMTQTLVSVSYMANLVVVILRGQTSSQRIMEVLDCESSITDAAARQEVALPADAPAIRLEGACYTYAGAAAPALQDVSLVVRSGETLGIIGGTGSGKSTLARLLLRLGDVTAGRVLVYDTDVRSMPLAQLRRLVSFVPQHVSLVSGTIRSNLTWRDPNADDDELTAALGRAQALEFVRALPKGLDAPVEAGGTNFSGGQRQRLTIARALVGHPRVLVLDDAASALDFATDARLRKALRNMRDELTTVVVSQRVSAVMRADRILVLDHGRVAGLGSHDELLEGCELYRQICASQLRQTGANERKGGSAAPARG